MLAILDHQQRHPHIGGIVFNQAEQLDVQKRWHQLEVLEQVYAQTVTINDLFMKDVAAARLDAEPWRWAVYITSQLFYHLQIYILLVQ